MGFEFICKECGRDLGQGDDFSYAAFLYGVFFLEGTNDGFIGTTCPACLKTAYIRVDSAQFESISDSIRLTFKIGGEELQNCFKYFSPVATFRMYGDLHKQDSAILSDEYVDVISSQDDIPLDGPEFVNANAANLYSSYGRWSQPVLGSFFHNIWVNHEQALKLIEMENADNVRMIPRYIFRNDLVVKAEDLYRDYYDRKEAHSQLVEEFAGTSLKIEELEEFSKELQFHETLTTLPIPADSPAIEILPPFLMTIGHPFAGINPDQRFSDASRGASDISDYLRFIETVKPNYNKDYSLRFLGENIDDFFNDYTQDGRFNIMRANWCHADLWKLISEYLYKYQRHVSKGLRKEQNYFFYKEGKGFRIRFDGKEPISGFDSLVFYYFYYLLKNANKSVSSEKMYQKCNQLKGMYSDDSITEEMESNATIGDYFYFADEGTKDFFATRRQELLQLQQNSDEHAASIIAKELEEMANSMAKEYFTKGGKRKKERTEPLKNTANAVGNAIEGAIRELRECGGGKVADHFEKCIDKPRGDSLKYETDDPEINWVL